MKKVLVVSLVLGLGMLLKVAPAKADCWIYNPEDGYSEVLQGHEADLWCDGLKEYHDENETGVFIMMF